MRTREQIMAQLEARYAELEAEAASPPVQRPCSACRWRSDPIYRHCTHPLVKGFAPAQYCWDRAKEYSFGPFNEVQLCGGEKALWAPHQTIVQRIINWIMGEG